MDFVKLLLLLIGAVSQISAQQDPAPTNPWKADRETKPQTDKKTDNSSYAAYHFAVKDFLIIIGYVFLGITLIVGTIVAFRVLRKRNADAERKQFEKEEADLMRRTNSLRDPSRGAIGMRGDLGPPKTSIV